MSILAKVPVTKLLVVDLSSCAPLDSINLSLSRVSFEFSLFGVAEVVLVEMRINPSLSIDGVVVDGLIDAVLDIEADEDTILVLGDSDIVTVFVVVVGIC